MKGHSRLRRILMTGDTIGGVWTYALELARALSARGVQVLLATMGALPNREQRDALRAIPNLELRESSYQLEWMDDPWHDVAAAGDWLLDLAREFNPDIVHLNGYAHGALSWPARTVVVGHSCVFSWWRAVHGVNPPTQWASYYQAVRKGLAAASLVVAPSQAMLVALQQHYGPLPSAMVIPNGRSRPSAHAQAKEKIILAAGRIWDHAKNIGLLAQVAPELPWPVCLAGETTSPSGIVSQPERVRSLGYLCSRELQNWYSRAMIYALPARYEPFGLSALEAALAGCVLVLGDIPSLREVWQESALFVSPDSAEALRDVLRELIGSPALLRQYSAKARAAALAYSAERMAASYWLAYRACLHQPGNGRQAKPVSIDPPAAIGSAKTLLAPVLEVTGAPSV